MFWVFSHFFSDLRNRILKEAHQENKRELKRRARSYQAQTEIPKQKKSPYSIWYAQIISNLFRKSFWCWLSPGEFGKFLCICSFSLMNLCRYIKRFHKTRFHCFLRLLFLSQHLFRKRGFFVNEPSSARIYGVGVKLMELIYTAHSTLFWKSSSPEGFVRIFIAAFYHKNLLLPLILNFMSRTHHLSDGVTYAIYCFVF